jgi:8-oxo-dGTP pyrophosphatase MutT (NUDIX family)
MIKHPWKKLSSKIVYQNHWIKVREDKVIRPDGSRGIYSVIDSKRGVMILPIVGDYIYLVKQYRYPVGRWFLEACAGGNSGHEHLSNLQLAKSELREELGFTAKKWTLLSTSYPSSGWMAKVEYIYLAQDLKSVGNCLDEDEFLEAKKISIKKFGQMVSSGKINDAYTMLAYYKLKEYLKL